MTTYTSTTPHSCYWRRRPVSAREADVVVLYIIVDVDSGLYKIGYASSACKRLNAIKKQEPLLPKPHNFWLIDQAKGQLIAEKYIHQVFAHKRIRGEWFDLSEVELAAVRSYLHLVPITRRR